MSKEQDKLVSVIVPVYNVEKYLDNCIESICSQTYKCVEIILIDDGSTDNSAKICDMWEQKDSRVRVLHKENGGLSSARNAGIELSTGDYIAFVDADDFIHEKYVEILYGLCEKNMCQIAQCDFLYIREEPNYSCKNRNLAEDYRVDILEKKIALRNCVIGANNVKYRVAWNKLYQRSLFSEIKYPLGKIHEDEFTTYKLIDKISRMAVADCYLYYYLQREDSIIHDNKNMGHLDRIEAYKERADFYLNSAMQDEYVVSVINYYNDIWYWCENLDWTNNQSVKEKLILEGYRMENEIMQLPGLADMEKIRILYNHLPDSRKRIEKQIWGNVFEKYEGEQFVFPFQIIQRDSKIVLYGAGNVGKTFYKQVKKTGYCQVICWVDNNWSYMKDQDNVEPIYKILDVEFDYIVIAICDKKCAESVKANLMAWGIPEEKIIWHKPDFA